LTGAEVKYKLKEGGYSLTNIALAMGITPQNLQSKLKSKDIKIEFLQTLAKVINKTVYFFIESREKNVELNVEPIVEVNDKNVISKPGTNLLEEPSGKTFKYQVIKNNCDGCKERDRIIAELWRIISQQRKQIDDNLNKD
jgi:transcriptional regulator with XRE-family HTH domain